VGATRAAEVPKTAAVAVNRLPLWGPGDWTLSGIRRTGEPGHREAAGWITPGAPIETVADGVGLGIGSEPLSNVRSAIIGGHG
jgi:hypothetical protein